jgi:hypothetical protein
MSAQQRVGAVADLPPGKVVGVGAMPSGTPTGATSQSRADAATLALTWRAAASTRTAAWFAPGTARPTTSGPAGWSGTAGVFAKVAGLDFGYRMLTRVLPLGRAPVTERDGELYIGG